MQLNKCILYNISNQLLTGNRQKWLRETNKFLRCSSSVAAPEAATLKVQEQINDRRKAALKSGGQKRIDAQHKKVRHNY